MSLFSTLNIAVQGLTASQTAIDVTGQNISNANTEGYSRKRVGQASNIRSDEVFGELGMGVEITDISRLRNTFIDQQIQEQSGDKGYYAQVDTALARLENLFKEPHDGSLNDGLNKFFNAWQDLANNPGDLAARDSVKAAAVGVTDLLHIEAEGMRQFRDDMDAALVKKVDEANDLMKHISDLNAEIGAAESQKGMHANDSRDQRDLLVRKLSEIVDVRTVEDAQGHVTVSTGGTLLVGPYSYSPLETYASSFTRPDGQQFATLGIRLQAGQKPVEVRGGEIKGIIDIKKTIIPEYEQKLDTLAAGLVTEVNALHFTGYSLNQHTGLDFFNPTGDDAAHISLADSILADVKNIAAATGGTSTPANVVPAGGIPAQASPTFDLKTLDPRYRFLAEGSVQITLTASGAQLQEGAGKDYVVDYTRGTITFLNYNRFAAADAVSVDFRYEQNGFPGKGDGSNALAIAQLRQQSTLSPDPTGSATQSFGDFYSAMIGTLGATRNQNANNLQIKDALIAQMDSEQASVAGVSIDEEMTNLIKYQHSYQASARIVSTVNQMMDVLMNL